MVSNNKVFLKTVKGAGEISKWLIFLITGVAIFIIMSGVVSGVAYLFEIPLPWLQFSEFDRDIPGFDEFSPTRKAKLTIADAISIALSFMLAASLIEQTMAPDYYHLGILGGLIILHIIIGYTVNKELEDAANAQENALRLQKLRLQAVPMQKISS
jgi:uncharacterized membrane protein